MKGGLGIRHLGSWNKVAILKILWLIFIWVGSLWVVWALAFVLCGRSL